MYSASMPPQMQTGWVVGPAHSFVPTHHVGLVQLGPQQPMVQSMAAATRTSFNNQQQHQQVDMSEVIAAIETLYMDELKPYGRILRKRLNERVSNNRVPADVDSKVLRSFCASCPWLYVQEEDGGEWAALVIGRMATFVDVYSPEDLYPVELWQAAAMYFERLDDSNMVLPGGRYSCAQALVSRNLPFLAGRSLGQVSHIVQLAISKKKLLGYLNGAVVPYGRSQSMLKEHCAERQRPCGINSTRGMSTLVSWDMMRSCLRETIDSMGQGASSIPLSNIKRLFRSKFQVELSETALGHAKLSELLQDSRLSDLCSVRLQGHGYVVVPLLEASKSQPIVAGRYASGRRSLRERAKWVQPLCLEEVVEGCNGDLSFAASSSEITAVFQSAETSDQPLPHLLGRCSNTSRIENKMLCAPKKLGYLIATTNIVSTHMEPTLSPVTCTAPMPPTTPTRQVLTPSTLGNLGFSVKNGFIHGAMPPTPVAGSSCRAHSLPRNMGSDKSAWTRQAGTPRGEAASKVEESLNCNGIASQQVVCLADLIPC